MPFPHTWLVRSQPCLCRATSGGPRQARLAPDRRGEGGKTEGGTWEPPFRWLLMDVVKVVDVKAFLYVT